ncbi:MAG: exodeoxyribonuclease III [Clostridia bacterium]|nr:exodeoxyribonuclease III [Clostridia bacterium]
MKIISWNVNGLRACIAKGFYEFLDRENPDIMCVQETKMQEGQADLERNGYFRFMNSAEKRGYSGTLIYSKQKPISAIFGIHGKYNDEGRVITLEFEKFFMVNAYVPNAQDELKRIDYRMQFEDDMRAYLVELKAKKPVIYTGDLNVAHNEIDLKNPKSNIGNPGFSNEERGKMTELLSAGFCDTFRTLYPEKQDYSWWSYRFQARQKNIGWRIDYFVVSNDIMKNVKDSKIFMDQLGSDHAPVCLEIEF